MCLKLGLIEGNSLFVDGSKFRGNAAIKNHWTPDRCERRLQKIDGRIETILAECERIDQEESASPSLVQLKEELRDKEALKARVEAIQKEIQASDSASVNTTDPDCVKVKGRQGTHAGYNSQIVVDAKHGLIVSSDVVSESNDVNQFANQIEQAQATLEKPCLSACGDAGYANTDELKKIDDKNIAVIVPTIRQAHGKSPKPFDKSQFRYDRDNDCYVCPQGHALSYSHKEPGHRVYEIQAKALCFACEHFGVCTKSKNGRRIRRLENEETKLRLEAQYQTDACQATYKLRKEKVELPFGHIKRNLGAGAFMLRGLEGVKAEMALLSSCFNIARMITLLGVQGFIARLAE